MGQAPAPTGRDDSAQQPLSLRRNFSWTLVGNVVYAACQWGMLVAIARLGEPEMVGQFALGLAITAPVFMCTNLNLRSLQATDANREFRFSHYLRLRLITTVLALLVIAAIGYFSGHEGIVMMVILLLGLAKAIESLSDVFYGFLQQNEQMRPIAISLIIRGVFSFAAVTAILLVTGNLSWAVFSLCVVWMAGLLLYDLPHAKRLRKEATMPEQQVIDAGSPSSKVLASLAWLAAPMGFVMFLISLNGNLPRYFIERQLGLAELGIFAAIAYLITAGGTVVAALGQSAAPRLSQYFAGGKKADYLRLLGKLSVIATVIGAAGLGVALLAGEQILLLLYGTEYSQNVALFRWLMAIAWLGYLGAILGYGMTAARRFRVQAPLYLMAVLATLIACFLLIPLLGLIGGALAMGVGALVQLAGGAGVIAHSLRRLAHPPTEERP